MKITDIRWTPVRLRFKEPEHASYGYRVGWINLVIEVETDEGIAGLGETYTASGPWAEAVIGGLRAARSLLVGQLSSSWPLGQVRQRLRP